MFELQDRATVAVSPRIDEPFNPIAGPHYNTFALEAVHVAPVRVVLMLRRRGQHVGIDFLLPRSFSALLWRVRLDGDGAGLREFTGAAIVESCRWRGLRCRVVLGFVDGWREQAQW